MAAHADANEAARALAAKRWEPETRLRAAAETLIARADELDAGTRAAIEAAITGEPSREDG
jgi:hypothetical protein